MRKTAITFGELCELLRKLGIAEAPQQPNRRRFEHPGIGTVLLFRAYESSEIVNDREMVVVRRQLVDNGLIEAPAFDRFWESASA